MLFPPDRSLSCPQYFSSQEKILIIILLALLANASLAGQKEKQLRVLAEFPTENQMNSFDYVLGRGTHFDTDENAIYYCSQRQHVVLKLDYNGNLIKRIGRNGQGPGEFQLPLVPCVIGDRLVVSDNGNSRIQIFTLDGAYVKQLRMIEGIYSLVSTDNQLYMHLLRQYEKRCNGPAIFARYDLSGKLLSYFGEIGKSDYNSFYNDNAQTIRAFNGELHCLQLYGTTYRIYNPNGELVRELKLEINPLHDKEYKKTGWLYTYRTFVVGKQRIYATHAGRGKIIINVFDREGKYLYAYSTKQETDEVSEVSDMKIIQRKDRRLLLLLVHYPETKFILAELDE